MVENPCHIVEQMFAALDRRDANAIIELMGADVVLVDEISRRWLKGRDEVADQIHTMLAAVQPARRATG